MQDMLKRNAGDVCEEDSSHRVQKTSVVEVNKANQNTDSARVDDHNGWVERQNGGIMVKDSWEGLVRWNEWSRRTIWTDSLNQSSLFLTVWEEEP